MYRRVLAVLSGLLLLIVAPAPARADTSTTGTVLGVVLDRGRPAPGIIVTLVGAAQTTDRVGRFRFSDVQPSTYQLQYRTPTGGMTQTSDPFTVEAGEVVRKTEAIGPHGALAGRILDNHGRPAGGAQIGSDFGRTYIHTVADSQGRFFLDYLPPRAYTVYVRRQPTGAPTQFVPRKTTAAEAVAVPIETDRVTRIEERLLPLGVIKGTFTGPDGPLGGALVAGNILTADDGSFQMYVWPGDVRLHFEYGTFFHQQQWATGALDEADATVFHVAEDQVVRHDERLLDNGTIGGRLLDHTGAPVGPATVQLTSTTYETATATTDSDGYWSAAVFPGDYQLRFAYQNLRLWTEWDNLYRVLPGQRTAVPDQRLVQPGDVEVGVTVDGEALQKFCLGLKFQVAGVFDFYECTETGTVLFTGLNPYDYNWSVSTASDSWSNWSGGSGPLTVTAGRLTKTTLTVAAAAS
jgi:carboxypeptidase family protein